MQQAGSLNWGRGGADLPIVRERGMCGITDEAVVERVLNGETDAFGILVQRYQDRVYSAIRNYVGHGEDALDLTQDVFVKAFAGLNSFRGNSAFYTWLYRIAMNTAVDFLRKRPALRMASLDDEVLREIGFEPIAKDPMSDPERTACELIQAGVLRNAIAKLSHKLKTALVLHDIEGLSQEEVAEILNCPVGTVKSRVSRARMEIRSMLAHFVEGGD
jgi:RNA polymerase sigma-70 factor, ECF subfamily